MILAIVLTQIALLGTALFIYYREKRAFMRRIEQFLTPAEEGGLSELGQLSQALGQNIGQSAVASMKGTMQGLASGQARGEKAVDGAIATDMVSMANPWIGMALKAFPTLAKKIQRNPELASIAIAKFQEMQGGNGNKQINQETADVDIFNNF